MTISPACLVNSSTPPVNVSGGSTVTITLASTAGVRFWSVTCVGTDELNTSAAVNATLAINPVTFTAAFTMPAGAGSAVIMQSQVGVLGPGLDANGVKQASYATTFKVNVLTAGGFPVVAANESAEQSAGFGWTTVINPIIRAGNSAGAMFMDATVVASGTSPFQASVNRVTRVNSATGSWVVKAPVVSSAGQTMTVLDIGNNAGANNISVTAQGGFSVMDPNTRVISAANGTVKCSVNNGSVTWVSDGSSNWYVV